MPLLVKIAVLCVVWLYAAVASAIERPVSFVSILSEPYAFIDETGKPAGAVVEMVNLLAGQANIDTDIYLVPALRVFRELESGQADLTIMPSRELIEQVADRIGIVSEFTLVAVTLKRNHLAVKRVVDLGNARVGYVKSLSHQELFPPNSEIIGVPILKAETGIEMLIKNRVDFFFTAKRSADHFMQIPRIRDTIKFAFEVKKLRSYLYVSNNSTRKAELKRVFKGAIDHLREKGKTEPIYGDFTIDVTESK